MVRSFQAKGKWVTGVAAFHEESKYSEKAAEKDKRFSAKRFPLAFCAKLGRHAE